MLVYFTLNDVPYYYVRNGQNDIVGILDNDGNEGVNYRYDTWGKLLEIGGSLASTVGKKNPYRYRGYRYDDETGLYYLQSRYYNPEIGRFINADGLVDSGRLFGHNMFAYCGNDPVNNFDPSGYHAASMNAMHAAMNTNFYAGSSYDYWNKRQAVKNPAKAVLPSSINISDYNVVGYNGPKTFTLVESHSLSVEVSADAANKLENDQKDAFTTERIQKSLVVGFGMGLIKGKIAAIVAGAIYDVADDRFFNRGINSHPQAGIYYKNIGIYSNGWDTVVGYTITSASEYTKYSSINSGFMISMGGSIEERYNDANVLYIRGY